MVDGPSLICPWSASHYMVDSRKIAAEEKWLAERGKKEIDLNFCLQDSLSQLQSTPTRP